LSEQLTISKIKEGTVIDHINSGKALLVLKILGIGPESKEIVSMAMNVPSKKMGKKDIVKVEGKFISKEELNRIALIAPKATINLIKDYEISKKFKVALPNAVEGILSCPNRNCITNSKEPVTSYFHVFLENDRVVARCHYCGKRITEMDKHII
jgi:aspartate carbamoyltransferase regulatory subunit